MILKYIAWLIAEFFAGVVAFTIYHFYHYVLFYFFNKYEPKYLIKNPINYKEKISEIFTDDRKYNFLIFFIPSVAIFIRTTYSEFMEETFGSFAFTVAFLQATATIILGYLRFKKIKGQLDRQ